MERRRDRKDLVAGQLAAASEVSAATDISAALDISAASGVSAASEDEESFWTGAATVFFVTTGTLLVTAWVSSLIGLSAADSFRHATVTGACELTGCSVPGMVAVGCLLALVPLLYVLAVVRLFFRCGRRGKIAWLVAGVVLIVVGAQFAAIGHGPSAEGMIRSPGGPSLFKGINAGIGALWVAFGTLGALRLAEKKWRAPFWAGTTIVLLLVTVVGVVSTNSARKDAGPLLTAQIFPQDTLRGESRRGGRTRAYEDDVLTRTASTDLVGCRDRYAGCLRSSEFQFTTNDSDAVIQFDVVSFPRSDVAWRVWTGLGRETGDPTSIRLTSVTNQWLVVATVRHADGRPIAAGEKKWLRWPARQLEYAFGDAVGYDRLAPEVSKTVAPLTRP
ncbi:hypothetical protein [Symbioplanes lichenis]|uniref:hypothetical protein n=1 Tax=Symbioplanes lichenis TaxID=1629072 RepID=UPI00273881B2|nr:hypothetical protein [Actinoplanes lichenis]